VRALLRKYPRFFLYSTLGGIALRALFLFRFPAITVDSFSYGDIAKNWLRHGVYGLTGQSGPIPTYTRLPGYPAFLAAIFSMFGMEHYRAVLAVQVFVDIATCFLIADLARRLLSERGVRARTIFVRRSTRKNALCGGELRLLTSSHNSFHCGALHRTGCQAI